MMNSHFFTEIVFIEKKTKLKYLHTKIFSTRLEFRINF
jgi:hypothetical protein